MATDIYMTPNSLIGPIFVTKLSTAFDSVSVIGIDISFNSNSLKWNVIEDQE